MQSKTKRKWVGGISLGLATFLAIGGSLAYFTDRESLTADGKAGTLDIRVENNIDLNQDTILDPGDAKDVRFTVTEDGNKSVDVRSTIVVTSVQEMTEENGQAEFEIYHEDDVEPKYSDKGELLGYFPKDGAKPLQARSISDDKTVITYKTDEYTLNGITANGSTDGNAEEDVNGGGNSKEHKYKLIFRKDSDNKFQSDPVSVDVVVEAKQHRNTKDKWDVIATDTYEINGPMNTETVKVVPKAKPDTEVTYHLTGISLDNSYTITIHRKNTAKEYAFPVHDGVATYTGKKLQPGTYVTWASSDKHAWGHSDELVIEDGKTDYNLPYGKGVTIKGFDNLGDYTVTLSDGTDSPWSKIELNGANGSWTYEADLGTYTGIWHATDAAGNFIADLPISLTIERDDTEVYDLSDQFRLPDKDSNGNAVTWRKLTVNIPNKPASTTCKVNLTNDSKNAVQSIGVNEATGNDSLSKTFLIATGGKDGVLGKSVTVSLTDADNYGIKYSYDGTDSTQTVDLTDADKTIIFTGTFTRMP